MKFRSKSTDGEVHISGRETFRSIRRIWLATALMLLTGLILDRDASFAGSAAHPVPEHLPVITEGSAALRWAEPCQVQVSDEAQAYRRVEEALSAGDVRLLFYSFADQVEISIMGDRSLYSRSQALYVMREFFRAHPPDRFEFDDAERDAGSPFALGYYWTRAGEQMLRIFVRMRVRDDRWELKELRIEPARTDRPPE